MTPISAPQADGAATLARRTRLWDLPDKYHCPIIGTCLSMDELVKFARRFSPSSDLRDEFSLHVEAVAWAGSRNPAASAMQKYLDRKYIQVRGRFNNVRSAEELCLLWRDHFKRGEVAGPLWITFTHKMADEETRRAVYADVHMLSHQVGASQAVAALRLAHLHERNTALAALLEQERKRFTAAEMGLRERIAALETERNALQAERAEAITLRERLAAFESGAAMVDMGRRLMGLTSANAQLSTAAENATEKSRTWAASVKAAEGRVSALERERDGLAAERNVLERLLLADGANADTCDGQCASCEETLRNRCVLCVGGRSSLVPQYRALAERLGIRLIHHDGGQEESLSRLPDMINGADAVICPTDCVSHAAYYSLKRHCKRSSKPCLLFKGSGISGFAVALTRAANGQANIAASSPAH